MGKPRNPILRREVRNNGPHSILLGHYDQDAFFLGDPQQRLHSFLGTDRETTILDKSSIWLVDCCAVSRVFRKMFAKRLTH